MSRERIQAALDKLLYLPHLQARPDDSLPAAGAAAASPSAPGGKGRPWDRGDLFRRLATFKSSTWFCKPEAISPVECARRGWTNTGPDLLACEFCKAKLSCPIPPDLLPDEAAASAARYASRLADAHEAACPWRSGASSPSLLQFPPLTQEAVRRDFEARCTALQRLVCLPPLAPEPYDALAAAAGGRERLDQLLLQGPAPAAGRQQQQQQQPAPAANVGTAVAEGGALADVRAAVAEGTAALGSPEFEARARVLALCGWDLKLMTAAAASAPAGAKPAADGGGAGGQQQQQGQQREAAEGWLPPQVVPESAALQCSLCSAKAGLWSFFAGCKPQVLQAPARRGAARAGGVASPSATVARTVSRNVAADIGMTIAGGAMQSPAAGAAAAPFGATGQQVPAFGGPASAQDGAMPAAGAEAQAPAAAQEAAAPFGAGASPAGVPVFGFAALQASRPAEAPGGGAQAGPHAELDRGTKRKQPDFSWSAVMADIEAKAAAEKRSKAAAAATAAGGAAAEAAGPTGGRGQQPSRQQQLVAAAAAARQYKAAQTEGLDPLVLHRPFCPWVNAGPAGDKEGRCGWRWCLQQLASPFSSSAAVVVPADSEERPAEGGGGGDDGSGGKEWNPAQLLRSVLKQVDVQK